MSNKHALSPLLIKRESQTKNTMWDSNTQLLERLKLKRVKFTIIGEDVEQLELSYPALGIWYGITDL